MKKAISILLNTVLIFFFIIAIMVIFSVLPIKNIHKLYSVMSGSMQPTIPVGAVVVVKPQSSYNIGDIITFKPVGAKTKSETVTHRIKDIKIINDQNTYVTKGDANSVDDQNLVREDDIIGKELFSVALVGYVLGYVKTLPGLFILIVIPAVIIIYDELHKVRRELVKIISTRRSNKSNKEDKNEKNTK